MSWPDVFGQLVDVLFAYWAPEKPTEPLKNHRAFGKPPNPPKSHRSPVKPLSRAAKVMLWRPKPTSFAVCITPLTRPSRRSYRSSSNFKCRSFIGRSVHCVHRLLSNWERLPYRCSPIDAYLSMLTYLRRESPANWESPLQITCQNAFDDY